MSVISNGNKYTFLELLKNCKKIVIPKIQRDYAQGRIDPVGSNLCRDVRENFINSINQALTKDIPLVLDYIYGLGDEAGFFYPIDGQQRLTTLFLLYWYVAIKENKLTSDIKTELSKFSYEIRDTSKEFCLSLLDITLNISDVSNIKKEIRDSAKYYRAYDEDPTVQAMMVMLDKIHLTFKETKNLWDKLNNITFWMLSLEKFGLTDDLFVKMNARGKRLSKFDTFKSELEAALDKRLKDDYDEALSQTLEIWKCNIDNEYLDLYWADYGKEYAERNIYRTIMLFVDCIINAKNVVKNATNDSWETNDKNASYETIIIEIVSNKTLLATICNVLCQYNDWKTQDESMGELLIKKDKTSSIQYYAKVRLFGVLYWWGVVEKSNAKKYFNDFYRILCNYVNSNREYSIWNRQYNSSIDAKTIGSKLYFVKCLIDGYKDKNCDFHSYIKTCKKPELKFEIQKLNYANFDEVVALEKCEVLKGVIHNFFFDDCVYIQATEIKKIINDPELKNKALRIILSLSNPIAGGFNKLVFDDTTISSGRRQLYYESDDDIASGYCHRFFIGSGSGFGDKVMTADGNSNTKLFKYLSNAVKEFAKLFHTRYYGQNKTVKAVLDEMLAERLQISDFSVQENILWYIVKYNEFFYSPSSTTFLVLRRKHYDGTPDYENVYDIRCMNENYNIYASHYNPFYLAVKNKLDSQQSKITVVSGLYITGNHIEYLHPCTLSNGWTIRVLQKGGWRIKFNGFDVKEEVINKYNINSGEYILKNNGVDCIELLSEFIMECN